MIKATEEDRAAIEAFLSARIATSMFPFSNLRRHGMQGGHPRAVSFWLRWQDGAICDVLAQSEEGMLFPQCPTRPWGEIAAVLDGHGVKGILGEASQVADLRAALRLPGEPALDTVEPLYQLALPDLRMPDAADMTLHKLEAAPLDVLHQWRRDYCIESLAYATADAGPQAVKDIESYIAQDSHRVLMRQDVPVAMTGFNASLPETVQIGGVYTPPALRNRGYARTALALHLAEAAQNGVKDAVLFAANRAASKAYEAIGFQQMGSFAVAIYDTPMIVHV